MGETLSLPRAPGAGQAFSRGEFRADPKAIPHPPAASHTEGSKDAPIGGQARVNAEGKVDNPRCIVILSEKSSGSSALQRLLVSIPGVRHVERTRHNEDETLYWTKAASILGRPQEQMVDSVVPMPAGQARAQLVELLSANLPAYRSPEDDRLLVFDGWRQLALRYSPVFVEKSPHHLFEWSALELLVEAIERVPEVEHLLVGLVRNPMDTLYSQYRRWGSRPEDLESQWTTAYENLERLAELLGDQLVIVRYEDLAASMDTLGSVTRFCGIGNGDVDGSLFHGGSVGRWRGDPAFGFALAPRTVDVARRYGYSDSELENSVSLAWPVVREFHRSRLKLVPWAGVVARRLRLR